MNRSYVGQKETCRLYNKNIRGWLRKTNLLHAVLLKY